MIASIHDFTEATLFERLALDRVHPVVGDECTTEIDLRAPDQQGGVIVHARLHCSTSADAVSAVVLSLYPLLFGAAWKILDLFIELALNLSDEKPKRANWSIDEKVKAAQAGKGFNDILTDDAALWRAVLAAYAATDEHRHCLVHRTAMFSNLTVQLSGVDRHGAPIRPLSKPELDAFIAIAQAVALAVIAGGLEARSADFLRFELDQLQAHTDSHILGGVTRSKPVMVRLMPVQVGIDLFELDFKAAYLLALKRRPDSHYDAWIELPDDSGRTLFARMDEVPKETIRFSLSVLPSYLALR